MTLDPRQAGLALLREYALIGGEPTRGSGEVIAVDDPATGEIIGHVPKLGASETEQAIRAADEAFPAWSQGDPHARGRFLRDWAGLIDDHADGLNRLQDLQRRLGGGGHRQGTCHQAGGD